MLHELGLLRASTMLSAKRSHRATRLQQNSRQLRRRRAGRLCQECCRARALLGRRGTPWQRQRMGTLDAPGAKTPFGHGVMELVHGSGKGVGEEESGREKASPEARRNQLCSHHALILAHHYLYLLLYILYHSF